MTIAADIKEKGHNEVLQTLSNSVNSVLTVTMDRNQVAELFTYTTGLVAISNILSSTSAETPEDTLKQIAGIVNQIIPIEKEDESTRADNSDTESKAD